ncbi:Polyamine aminopropyltransferase [Sulfuracidifex tepidarius]|uniref:Polyamine aminopropyltransferase n=2 Tax=Sulfuracidifex tepidarius TaxID=1294262 RepID=A0A510DW28_9CREN|nr:Polyamine aminopropyltransferase [Sulfuracidifex tepidarius]BBG27191.1 Polyamine aminopropyltransferase [Sulfuracidifex tepidarius]
MSWHWLIEWQTPYEFHGHEIKRVIAEEKTQYQSVMLVEFTRFGKGLIIDGKVQSTIYDEHVYHESLVHPIGISLDPSPKSVLILGGGEGATLREALKYNSVEKAVMVDLDEKVIEFAKNELKEWHMGSFDDNRTELIIGDGLDYIKKTNQKFDLVILDLTDPLKGSTSYKLYTKEFYEDLKKVMNKRGGIVTQATSPSFSLEVYSAIYTTLKQVFSKVSASYTYIASFDGLWGFVYASDDADPSSLSKAEIENRIKSRINSPLRWYDSDTHISLFSLPKNIRKSVAENTRISTEADPIYVPA